MEPHLIRVLALVKPYLKGQDVEAVRRGGLRYLEDDKGWAAYKQMSLASRRTFGPGMTDLVKRVERKAGLHIDGKAGASVDRILRVSGGYDGTCYGLLKAYADAQVTWCYPHPLGANSSICQKLHETAGLDDNMAFDFCAAGGTKVLAVVASEVVKISGHPPTYVPDAAVGIFGWNLHYVTPTGYRWFSTHYGKLTVRVGQVLRVGQQVGEVGRWPGDPGRSHTHLGVTSPHGRADAVAWINRVAYAPRVAA